MPIPVTVQGVGLTVELMLFRAYGRRGNTSAMLTAALDLNPGIAGLGAVLPLGTAISLPDLPASPARVKRTAVDLFGT